MKQYIEVQIDDNNVVSITCPDPDCRQHGVIDAAEVIFLFCRRSFFFEFDGKCKTANIANRHCVLG